MESSLGKMQVQLIDMVGRILDNRTIHASGKNKFSYPLSRDLKGGIYLLKVQTDHRSGSIKFPVP